MSTHYFEFADGRVELDEDGFLLNSDDWNEAIANALALADGITLEPVQWQLVRLAREYYKRYHMAPGMRILAALAREHMDCGKVDSRTLYRWFPQSPARQVCCYAGLPKPATCI